MNETRENFGEHLSEDVVKLLSLVEQAGRAAKEARDGGLQISDDMDQKGFVTSGDIAVDKFVHEEARLRFPDAVVLSEETKADFNPRDHQEVLIVDPIDGTRWYKDGGDLWSINSCLVRNGELVAAAVHQPDLGIYTFAEKGNGTYCLKDGKLTKVSANSKIGICESKIGVGTNFASPVARAQISKLQEQIGFTSMGEMVMESSGYELANIARGLLPHAYLHPQAKPWDKAAGILLINEAGGKATGWPGKDLIFGEGIIAAANPELYEAVSALAAKYIYEDIHDVPGFDAKKRRYFQDFMVRHLGEARLYKQQGLLNEEGSGSWRNVARHQLLSGVITETVTELLAMPEDEVNNTTHLSLIHDVDKRRQQEELSKTEVYIDESQKTGRPLRAVGSNFRDFDNWNIEEYVLRYVDSSVGEDPHHKTAGHWYGPRLPSQLPKVMILPWRERIAMFKANKIEEGERGIPLYGMTLWEKLEQMMTTIEQSLFEKIIQNNPDLAERYTAPLQLTELIEDRIHEKILSS